MEKTAISGKGGAAAAGAAAWASKAGFPECPARASDSALRLIGGHLGLSSHPDGAGARLVLIGRETPSLLWFAFADERGGEAWIGMAPAGGERWVFNGRTVKLCYRAGDADQTPLHRRALQLIGAKLDGAPFSRFLRIIVEPPAPAALDRPAPAAEPAAAPGEKPRSLRLRSEDWNHPDHWREFCDYSVIDWCPSNTFLGNSNLSGAACSLRYGDLECQSSHLFVDNAAVTPWRFSLETVAGEGACYLALMDDMDVIHGTGVEKIERILDALEAEPAAGALEFFNCCIPMMTGADVKAPLAKFSERTGRAVIFSDMSPLTCHPDNISRQLRRELTAARRDPARPPDGRYDLVGLRPSRGRDELTALLAGAGARLHQALLPAVDLQALARYQDASAQALLPNRYYEEAYSVLDALPLPALKGLAPFGREGSKAWLRGLAALLEPGVAPRLEAALSAHDGLHGAAWEDLAGRARVHRAGFVLGPGDAERLADPSYTGGVLVPAFLDELGFGLDFLVYDDDRDGGAEKLRASLPGAARHAVSRFSDRAALHALLGAGRLSIAYSNARNDTRLTRNGLLGFALRDLEPGLDGALRSAKRLVERCETAFFRENAARLRAAR